VVTGEVVLAFNLKSARTEKYYNNKVTGDAVMNNILAMAYSYGIPQNIVV